MNCKRARTWFLLAETGELTEERRGQLDRHAADCAECRRYAASLRSLRGEYSTETVPLTATPPPTLDAILIAARQASLQRSSRTRTLFFGSWTWPERALAMAAALLALLGLSVTLLRGGNSDSTVALDKALIERQVASAVAGIEAEWTAWEGEMALVALEIGDWYLTAGNIAEEMPSPPANSEAGT